jgi:eukaryotic-like serine/threonine-protein kinase
MNDAPDSPSTERDEAIFHGALQLPPEQRAEYLRLACGGDEPLRGRVAALLTAHEQSGAFLKDPAPPSQQKTIVVSLPLTEKAGDRIGRYKLLQVIGEGGCGVVYMAEQQEPVSRRVALKVIKLGMDTKTVVARFEAERQALAMMDHPNIAKVLDAGATETGRPFFVMELVRGIKITEYCDQNKLPAPERLELFIQVCQAIQHAHQKGIIHRDIKPSNILVTLHDGVPVPKVIDFGIAKATQGRLTDQTLFTAFEQFIGTPAYMSPEQAEMSGLDIDTRCDVYALGVLLYELLTGQTPFDARELLASGIEKMRQTIRDREPDRPSTRLQTMLNADRTLTADRCRTDVPKLIHLLRGDLDWIVMKALEKDRTRRYETANGLALDVRRHLNNEAVIARPPSNFYRLQKLARRNKVAVMAGSAVIIALVAGFAISTVLFLKEREARKRAMEAERIQAALRIEAEQGRALAKKDLELAQLRPQFQQISQLLATEQFDEAEKLFNQLPPRAENVPFYLAFGNIHTRLGRWNEALADFSKIVEYTPSNYLGYIGLAVINGNYEDWPAARTNLMQAIEVAPSDHEAYYDLGPLLVHTGDLPAYHVLRDQVLRRFGGTRDSSIAERTAKEFLLLPPPAADLATFSKLADIAITGPEGSSSPFNQFVKGLAEYRTGHFASAADWMRRALKAERDVAFRNVAVYAVLAMSQYQLKQGNEARAAQAKGVEMAKDHLPQFGSRNLGPDWKDVIIARVLLSEAQQMIESDSKANGKSPSEKEQL